MPLYEYYCYSCRRRVTLYLRQPDEKIVATCPRCGSRNMHRLFSTFAIGKTYKDLYENILSDSQLVKGLESNDPQALAEWNKRMSSGMDEEVEPQYAEMLGRMEAGAMPSEMASGMKGNESERETE